MTLVTRRHDSGLVLAEDAWDETRVSRALKQIDSRLVLQKRERDENQHDRVLVYKVVKVVSDRYAPVVFTWIDEQGRPLPLSFGLVDEFKRHMLGVRTDLVSADEHNRRLVEERARDAEALTEAVIQDHRARFDRERVTVSLATSRQPRYWRRENARPRSGRQG